MNLLTPSPCHYLLQCLQCDVKKIVNMALNGCNLCSIAVVRLLKRIKKFSLHWGRQPGITRHSQKNGTNWWSLPLILPSWPKKWSNKQTCPDRGGFWEIIRPQMDRWLLQTVVIRAARLQTDAKGSRSTPFPCTLSFFVTSFLSKSSALPTVQSLGVTFTATMTADYKGPYSLGSCIILIKKVSGFTVRCVCLSPPPPLWVCSHPQALITQLLDRTLKAGACKKTKLRRVRQRRRGHIQEGSLLLFSAHRDKGSAHFKARPSKDKTFAKLTLPLWNVPKSPKFLSSTVESAICSIFHVRGWSWNTPVNFIQSGESKNLNDPLTTWTA